MNQNISNLYLRPSGNDQNLTVSDTVVSFAAFPSNAKYVQWQCQDADVRVTFDGADPTSSAGLVLQANDSGTWHILQAEAMKAIRRNASDAVIWAQPVV